MMQRVASPSLKAAIIAATLLLILGAFSLYYLRSIVPGCPPTARNTTSTNPSSTTGASSTANTTTVSLSSSPTNASTTSKSISAIFAVYNGQMEKQPLSSLHVYVRPGDSIDLVSGNDGGTLNVTEVLLWASQLHSNYPSAKIYARTTGYSNYEALAKGISSSGIISGIFYDYEPNFANEPEFSWNMSATTSNYANITKIAHAYGLISIGYPTGRPILESDLQRYGWNYATLAGRVDLQVVQSQTYCSKTVSAFTNATMKVLGQYDAAGFGGQPIFQVTIGSGGLNAVSPQQGYACTSVLIKEGSSAVYVWWSSTDVASLISYLEMLRA